MLGDEIAWAMMRRTCSATAGRSPGDRGVRAARLVVTERAVAKHTAAIFTKLDLQPSDDDNRRVLAVLTYLGR